MLVELETSGAFQISGYREDDDETEAPSRPNVTLSLPEPPEPPRTKHRMAEFLRKFAER